MPPKRTAKSNRLGIAARLLAGKTSSVQIRDTGAENASSPPKKRARKSVSMESDLQTQASSVKLIRSSVPNNETEKSVKSEGDTIPSGRPVATTGTISLIAIKKTSTVEESVQPVVEEKDKRPTDPTPKKIQKKRKKGIAQQEIKAPQKVATTGSVIDRLNFDVAKSNAQSIEVEARQMKPHGDFATRLVQSVDRFNKMKEKGSDIEGCDEPVGDPSLPLGIVSEMEEESEALIRDIEKRHRQQGIRILKEVARMYSIDIRILGSQPVTPKATVKQVKSSGAIGYAS